MSISTKQDERDVLAKIKELVEGLGPDSYVGTAFEGCFEIAEQNIQEDVAYSLLYRLNRELDSSEELKKRLGALEMELASEKKNVQRLERALEREQEWKPYLCNREVSEDNYLALKNSRGAEWLSDEAAKDWIYHEYGFSKELVKILHEAPVYEINRHSQLRIVGTVEREPYYFATDWYYIRFECVGQTYELYNGTLAFV